MWNVVQICGNNQFILRGYDKRPLRFIEKAHAERLAHELNEQNKIDSVRFLVVENNKHE